MSAGEERRSPGLADPDALYEALIELHQGLDDEGSHLVNAKLILLMANEIGDEAVLHRLLREAAAGVPGRDERDAG